MRKFFRESEIIKALRELFPELKIVAFDTTDNDLSQTTVQVLASAAPKGYADNNRGGFTVTVTVSVRDTDKTKSLNTAEEIHLTLEDLHRTENFNIRATRVLQEPKIAGTFPSGEGYYTESSISLRATIAIDG